MSRPEENLEAQEEALQESCEHGRRGDFISWRLSRPGIPCSEWNVFLNSIGYGVIGLILATVSGIWSWLFRPHVFTELAHFAIAHVANVSPTHWTVDSGATKHMCTYRECFTTLKPYSAEIFVANKEKVFSKGIGTVRIKTPNGFKTIHEVLYVPDLSSNLLSVPALTKTGVKVSFYDSTCDIIGSQGNVLMKANEINGLYKIVCDPNFSATFPVNPAFCNLSVDSVETKMSNCELWHRRLGHLNYDFMKKLFGGLIVSVPKFKFVNCPCTTCLEGKMCKKIFPKGQSNRATDLLDLVHTDVVGPIKVSTFGGGRYLINFIDDYSRMTFGYIIKKKSDVFKTFTEFKALVETQTERKIKILRSDNGTEYFNDDFSQFCKKNGIIQQSSTRYTPQQNGVGERANRSVLDRARCLLIESKLDIRFWGEAVLCSIYLKNRSPTKAVSTTPYEAWYGKKPNISHLRVFGSVGYAFVPKELRSKFDPRSKPYVLIGYSERSKAYRLADPSHPGKVVISRDVTFLEGIRLSDVDAKSYDSINYEPDLTMPSSHYLVPDAPAVLEQQNVADGADHETEIQQPTPSNAPQPVVQPQPNQEENQRRYPVRERKPKIDPDMYYYANVAEALGDPMTRSEALSRPDAEEWKKAMDEEYESLMKNGTWTLVDRPPNTNIVGSKWVFKLKRSADGTVRHKARLVAQGFSQKSGVDYFETYSPTIPHSVIRLLFALSAKFDWKFYHLDVQTAFLNGDLLENVYLQQPEGYILEEQKLLVCHLRKALYGLKQASRAWNIKANKILTELGFEKSPYEPCLFFQLIDNKPVILVLYVDDFLLFVQCELAAQLIISRLEAMISIRNLGPISEYLGIRVKRVGDSICLDQSTYIQTVLQRFHHEDCKPAPAPMEHGLKLSKLASDASPAVPYRELVGSLMYVAICTRPDIMFALSYLSQFNSCFDQSHWVAAQRVLKYLKGSIDCSIRYSKDDDDIKIFCDADWGSNFDRRSFSGIVSILSKGPVFWQAKKQSVQALSSTEAEYVSLCEGAREAFYVYNLLSYLVNRVSIPVPMYCDNQSAIFIANDQSSQSKFKHVDVKWHYVRSMVEDNYIVINYVPTNEMPADILTKSLPVGNFRKCKLMFNML